jgi:iron(III) transport system substrate-binding protein
MELAFEAAHPAIDVRWLDMGSQEVLDRVRSEKANPQADVWYGGPHTIFARGVEQDLLAAFRPSWADAVDSAGRGPGDRYFAVYLTPAVIVYNRDALSRDEAPHDWDNVLEPRFTDRVLIRDPLASGTMRAIFGMILERSMRETGDTARGMRWLRRLDAQTREYVLNPALLYEKLSRREGWITLWDLPDIQVVQAQGRPLGYVFPRSGTPVIVDAIGVVRGARHREAAHLFVEWVGGVEAQLVAAREAYRLPARTDLPADSLPDWVRDVRAEMVAAELDWAMLAERGDDWMRWWDRRVRGTGRSSAAAAGPRER